MRLPLETSPTSSITFITRTDLTEEQSNTLKDILIPTGVIWFVLMVIMVTIWYRRRIGYSGTAFYTQPIPRQMMNTDPVVIPQRSNAPRVTPFPTRGSGWNSDGIDAPPPNGNTASPAEEVALRAISPDLEQQARRLSNPLPPIPASNVCDEEDYQSVIGESQPSNYIVEESATSKASPPAYELSLGQAQPPVVREL